MKISKGLLAIIVVAVIIIGWAASSYNSLVSEQEKATTAVANLQSAYQRRADSFPTWLRLSRGMLPTKNRRWKM